MPTGTVQEINDERKACGFDLLELLPGLGSCIALVDPLRGTEGGRDLLDIFFNLLYGRFSELLILEISAEEAGVMGTSFRRLQISVRCLIRRPVDSS